MKLYKKDGKVFAYKKEVIATDADYAEAKIINPDGLVTASNPNGWTVYDKSASYAEVFNMLCRALTDAYPRWQVGYNQVGTDNCICYFKTPQKGIISKIDTFTWWDDNSYKRAVSSFDIYGFNSEADLLAFTNGTKIFECRIVIHSNLKGDLHTINAINEQPFQYFAIKMNIVNASDGYKSIGATKFYMKLPAEGYITKYYGFK